MAGTSHPAAHIGGRVGHSAPVAVPTLALWRFTRAKATGSERRL
jgi:hypothetical protein